MQKKNLITNDIENFVNTIDMEIEFYRRELADGEQDSAVIQRFRKRINDFLEVLEEKVP